MARKSELVDKVTEQEAEINRLNDLVKYHKLNSKFWEERWVDEVSKPIEPYDQEEEQVNTDLEDGFDVALASVLGELIFPEDTISDEIASKATLAIGAVILMLENKATSIAVRTGDSFAALYEEYTSIVTDAHDLRKSFVIDGDEDEFWKAATELYESLAS